MSFLSDLVLGIRIAPLFPRELLAVLTFVKIMGGTCLLLDFSIPDLLTSYEFFGLDQFYVHIQFTCVIVSKRASI